MRSSHHLYKQKLMAINWYLMIINGVGRRTERRESNRKTERERGVIEIKTERNGDKERQEERLSRDGREDFIIW